MQMSVPTGYLVDDHQVFGDPGAGSIISRMYDLQLPDMSSSDEQQHIDLEQDCRSMLGSVKEDERAQLIYYTSSDCPQIERFNNDTKNASVGISCSVRDELVSRYHNRVVSESLIHSNLRFSISSKMPRFIKDDGRKVHGFADVFKIITSSFNQREQFFNMLLKGYGGSCTGLDNEGHYQELLRYWSPGQCRTNPLRPLTDFDWTRTIDDLCRFSGLSPRVDPAQGFYMDGYYFGLMVAKTMPRDTGPATMSPFVKLSIPNLRVVLNMQPLNIEEEIRYEEERHDKLQDNLVDDKGKTSLAAESGLPKHKSRHALLTSGECMPYKAQLIVIACERSPDKLDERMEALRVALGKTGCEPWQPALATSVVSFFNSGTPGFGPWNEYRDYWHKMNDAVNVANMWTAASTPKADLDTADWIMDGDCSNLIGGMCFKGGSPIHMLVAGGTGSGKTSTVQSIALQVAPKFGYMVVIDDGSGGKTAWARTCPLLDPTCKTIVVRANGDQTFNPFQTDGPLTPEHINNATALVHLLVGQHSDEDKDKLRHAIISETISEVYAVAYRKWRKDNPEAYHDIRQSLGSDADADTSDCIQSSALATWTPEMFPTLSDLQDELHSASIQKGPHQEFCATLASLLRPWLRDGDYGKLVDGQGNIDLGSVDITETDPLKVVHFELEKITNKELRAVVGFLITQQVRQHIQGMPRGIKKMVVIEEMMSFLKIPNGEEIVIDYYERMRKYSCQVISVFQQYSTLLSAHPTVAKAIIGNCSSMLLLRNHNTNDLKVLSGFLPEPLPKVIMDHIKHFNKPSDMKPEEAYAGFVYVQLDSERPKYTVGRNYTSKQVDEITNSSGDRFDKKMEEFNK